MYTVTEVTPPEGYNLSETATNSVDIKFDGDQERVEFVNTKIRGNIEFTKYGEDNNPLEGATFALYEKSDVQFERPIKVEKSNAEGKVVYKDVEYGTYVIKEIKAPKGYILSEEILEAIIAEEGITISANPESILNKKIRGSLQILKIDRRNEKPLANATFTLYDINMVTMEELITGKDGIVIFCNLEYGKYFYEETKSPSGYYRDKTVYELNIPEQDDEILLNGFVIEKIFENKRKSTDGGGGGTPTGPDTPVEPEAPVVPEVPIEPEIPVEPENPQILVPVVPTDPEQPVNPSVDYGNILITKMDTDSKPLEGAWFTLYDKQGSEIKTVISDVNGKVLFSNLSFGVYSVAETKAPEGYELFDDDLMVNINSSKTLKYNFRNAPEGIEINDPDVPVGWQPIEDTDTPLGTGELPDTGSYGTLTFLLLGFVLVFAGLMMLLKRQHIS